MALYCVELNSKLHSMHHECRPTYVLACTGCTDLFIYILRHRTQWIEASILWSHCEETKELPGERDNARNNARCTQARKATHGLDGVNSFLTAHQHIIGHFSAMPGWKSQSE